jgi:antitoxin (DNA-binding transcriptional repressor) of toxin-antitoxin stability system
MKNSSIKHFRQHLSEYADIVESGEAITVFRRSKAVFKVVPINTETDEQWETVIDFTEGGNKKGAAIDDVITALETMENEDG